MSRDGFRIADVDVGALHDRKVARLRHDAPDEGEAAIRIVVWLELVLSSWREGERVTLGEIDSPFAITDERVEALRDVGLTDAQGRIPAKVWAGWFGPAATRREQRRGAARGRWHPANADANAGADADANASAARADRAQNGANASANASPVRPSDRPTTKSVESVRTPRAPASAREEPWEVNPRFARPRPDPNAIHCRDYDGHKSAHRLIADRWRCVTCEQEDAAADPLSFKEKVARASADRGPDDGPF